MKGWGMLEATATRFDRMNLEVCREAYQAAS
jgi:hypothetical protein